MIGVVHQKIKSARAFPLLGGFLGFREQSRLIDGDPEEKPNGTFAR